MNVGDFTPTETTDTAAESDEFTFCGETFEIPATVGSFALLRYGSYMKVAQAQETRGTTLSRRAKTDEGRFAANREIVAAEMTAQAAIYELLKACLGEGQLDRFGELADGNGVTFDGLMGVAGDITEAIAGRPTRRSSDSSDGPSTTGETSTAAGSGPTETPLSPREIQAAALAAST